MGSAAFNATKQTREVTERGSPGLGSERVVLRRLSQRGD